jgi:hypothetical protein
MVSPCLFAAYIREHYMSERYCSTRDYLSDKDSHNATRTYASLQVTQKNQHAQVNTVAFAICPTILVLQLSEVHGIHACSARMDGSRLEGPIDVDTES